MKCTNIKENNGTFYKLLSRRCDLFRLFSNIRLHQLHPGKKPQQVAGYITLLVLAARPPPVALMFVPFTLDGEGVPVDKGQLVDIFCSVVEYCVHHALVNDA